MRLMQAEQSIFIQDLVVVLPTAFHFSPLSKMLCLHQSQKRYRKPYDDSANIKLTDMKRTFLHNLDNYRHSFEGLTLQKKTK